MRNPKDSEHRGYERQLRTCAEEDFLALPFTANEMDKLSSGGSKSLPTAENRK
jgi:hypothetical protein